MTYNTRSDDAEEHELKSTSTAELSPLRGALGTKPSLSHHDEEGEDEKLKKPKLKSPVRSQLRTKKSQTRNYIPLLSLISLIVGLMNVIVAKKGNSDESSLLGKNGNNQNVINQNSGDDLIFSCPGNITKSANDKDAMLTEFYDDKNFQIEESAANSKKVNETELKNVVYDGWDYNYYGMKKKLYEWKSEHFSSLKSGDSIFESGCGIGLNILMTVEILKESANIEDLKVYGIEYVPKSVIDANINLNQLLTAAGNATLGAPICRGDATDLNFIPSNSFDLAYTGKLLGIVIVKSLQENTKKKAWVQSFADIINSFFSYSYNIMTIMCP